MKPQWITTPENAPQSGLYLMRKRFTARRGARLTVQICAISRYRLCCNGHPAAQGPTKGPCDLYYYDTVSLDGFLTEGENELTVAVQFISTQSGRVYTSVHAGLQPALFLRGELTENGESCPLLSDETWEVARDGRVSFERSEEMPLPPAEDRCEDGQEPLWQCAVPYEYCLFDRGCVTEYGLCDPMVLAPSPLPQQQTEDERPFAVVRTDFAPPSSEVPLTVPAGTHEIELDAGQYLTADVCFVFESAGAFDITVTYAEAYRRRDADGTLRKVRRDVTDGVLTGMHDTLHVAAGTARFTPFSFKTFRFVKLTVRAEAAVSLQNAAYRRVHYPLQIENGFACSDALYNRFFRISVDTVLNCMHETYDDCPYYEQQQYAMDSALQMLFSFQLSSDTRLARKALTDLASSAAPDGLLCANTPARYRQVIPTFSLFWIFGLSNYYLYSGDRAFVRELCGTVDKILWWFELRRDADGLVGPTGFWPFVDWVDGWETGVVDGDYDGTLTFTSQLYAYALGLAADMFTACGRDETARAYRRRRQAVNRALNEHCYDSTRHLYRDRPYAEETETYSEHGQIFAVLCGARRGAAAVALLRRMQKTTGLARCSFCMQLFRHMALRTADCPFDFDRSLDGWREMTALGCTTWFEHPGDARSDCHAWSAAILYTFTSYLLGLRPLTAGCTDVEIDPHPCGLAWLSGSLPTPHGPVTVSVRKEDGGYTLRVNAPATVHLHIRRGKETLTPKNTDTVIRL